MNNILIFPTQRNLSLLTQSEHLYTDETFKTVSFTTFYFHNFTRTLPLVSALLLYKTEDVYVRLLRELKNIVPSLFSTTLTIVMINKVISHSAYFVIQNHTRYKTEGDFEYTYEDVIDNWLIFR